MQTAENWSAGEMHILIPVHYYHSCVFGSSKVINSLLWLGLFKPQNNAHQFLHNWVLWDELNWVKSTSVIHSAHLNWMSKLCQFGQFLREKKALSLCQATRWGIKNALTYCNLGNVPKPKNWARRGNWGHFWLSGHWASSSVPISTDLFQTTTTLKFS